MTTDTSACSPAAPSAGAWSEEQLRRLRHDLRTPVNHIIGYSELLLEKTEEQGSLDLGQRLATITKLGHALLKQLTDALATDRFAGGPLAVAKVRRDLRMAVVEILGDGEILKAEMRRSGPGKAT
jgi:K+-sensing histidine kinase KdpD